MPTIQDGRRAIDQGNLQQARLIFEAVLQENPRSEEAWLGLAEILTDTEDKRICYENVLKINKNNVAAKEGLRNLEPQADPLVAALSQTASPEEEGFDFDEDEPTLVSEAPAPAPVEEESETSLAVLVAVGLALSLVVFAVGGGVVYFVLSMMSG